MYGAPERTEDVKITLTMTRDQVSRHQHQVGTLLGHYIPVMGEGDTLKVAYRFNVEYHGGIVEKLECLAEILADPRVGAEQGTIGEYVQFRCLIRSVLVGLDRVIERGRSA